jgi:hypothetical protein
MSLLIRINGVPGLVFLGAAVVTGCIVPLA